MLNRAPSAYLQNGLIHVIKVSCKEMKIQEYIYLTNIKRFATRRINTFTSWNTLFFNMLKQFVFDCDNMITKKTSVYHSMYL
jgi:hypothetical protein